MSRFAAVNLALIRNIYRVSERTLLHGNVAQQLPVLSSRRLYTLKQCCHVKPLPRPCIRPVGQPVRLLSTNSVSRQGVMIATYMSFGLGGCLLIAIVGREVKKAKLRFRGVNEIDEKAWRRVKLYKYKDVSIPDFVVKVLDDVENFEVRDSDIWVVSFPRSGSTWLQEIVYLLQSDLDFTTAKKVTIDERFPYLEFLHPGVKEISARPSPRLIKSHLPLSLLPKQIHEKNPKIIYIARNPKDVVVSFFYFIRMLKPVTRYDGKFEDFLQLFIQDKVMYTPWWRHVLQFWEKRQDGNILFLKYENLKHDPEGCIRQIADFLGKPVTNSDVISIKEHCRFENMKKNKMTNFSWFQSLGISDPKEQDFIRKGTIGDWKNHLTPEMDKKLEAMVAYKLHKSELGFNYGGRLSTDENNTATNNGDKNSIRG